MSHQTPIILVSAVALQNEAGEILMAQRPEGKSMAGLWEFPGGKVETGETPEQALVRELAEELAIRTQVTDFEAITFASHTYDDFHLLMPVFLCRHWQGEMTGVEGQALQWVPVDQLDQLPMPPADVPLVEILQKILA